MAREAAAGLVPAAAAFRALREWWESVADDGDRRLGRRELDSIVRWAIGEALADPERIDVALRDRSTATAVRRPMERRTVRASREPAGGVLAARPELGRIRQAAHARARSADAVLGAVLARVAMLTPPTMRSTPASGSPAPLNTLRRARRPVRRRQDHLGRRRPRPRADRSHRPRRRRAARLRRGRRRAVLRDGHRGPARRQEDQGQAPDQDRRAAHPRRGPGAHRDGRPQRRRAPARAAHRMVRRDDRPDERPRGDEASARGAHLPAVVDRRIPGRRRRRRSSPITSAAPRSGSCCSPPIDPTIPDVAPEWPTEPVLTKCRRRSAGDD